jgi:uncharacterized membrane protein YfcA
VSVLGLALAVVVGLSLGMLGGGGSILTVPIFVYVGGFAAKSAVAMSLPVVGATSLIGAVSHWRSGNVHLRSALLFGSLAMVGAFAGAKLSELLTGETQLALLGVVMLAAAIAMFRQRAGVPAAADGRARGVRPVLPLVALGVGVLTGIVGIGGGFLVVPALVLLAGLPMKQAIGTSLVVIAMNAAAGLLGYVGSVSISWSYVALFSTLAIAGILAGSYLVRFVSPNALRRSFAVFLVLMGALILIQNAGIIV